MGVLTQRGFACLALAVTLAGVPVIAGGNAVSQSDVAVKAAFLLNFAKFTEWPLLPAGGSLILCVVGDDEIAGALAATVRGQRIDGRALEVRRSPDIAAWSACNVLFFSDAQTRGDATALGAIKTLPVLTIGDRRDFALAGGIIELYVEAGKIRFAINRDAANRSGLRLSSRLLGLAKLVGGNDGP